MEFVLTLWSSYSALHLYLLFGYYCRDGSGPNCEVSREVGLAICEAFVEADKVCGHLQGSVYGVRGGGYSSGRVSIAS